ncbi:MAG: glycerol-3-phosphate dehydrogenase [Nitrospiria bacterium]
MDRIGHLNHSEFDLIVIGGGSVGAGIARDAAMRGLTTLLVEKGDFGCGTSSRTSKIVHGGIRYLEQGEIRLVIESLRERFILQKIAPHLVHPLPFLIPVFKDGPRPLWMIRAGLWIYDALSMFRNKQRFQLINREEILRLLPGLEPDRILGGGIYYDSQMNDARLVLENVLDAKSSGATVLNYVQVEKFRTDGKKLTGVVLNDKIEGGRIEVGGRAIVNAGGPWVSQIAADAGDKNPIQIRTTQGTHIIVPSLSREYAIVVTPKEQKRIFFIIPWYGNSLIGTTDLDYEGDPSAVHPLPGEIDYLLGETRKLFPRTGPKKEDIIAIFSGLRPLLNDRCSDPSAASRRSKIAESASGLISIAGGKFTTYRSIAEKAVDLVGRRLARTDLKECRTSVDPLYGGKLKKSFDRFLEEDGKKWAGQYQIDLSIISHLIGQYGSRTKEVLNLVEKDRSLGERISPAFLNIKAEIVYSIEIEMALTLSDFLRRRTLLGLSGLNSQDVLLQICSAMGKVLSWNQDRVSRELENYRKDIYVQFM